MQIRQPFGSTSISSLAVPASSLAAAASVALLCALTPAAAHAQTVVFTNALASPADAAYSDPNYGLTITQTFGLSSTTSFDTLTWVGSYFYKNTPLNPDKFTISFYNTVGGVPIGAAFQTYTPGNATSRIDTHVQTISSVDEYDYSLNLGSQVVLTAGTYGVSISNDTTGTTDDYWGWCTSSAPVTASDQAFVSGSDTPIGVTVAFSLVNSAGATPTPEPGMVVTGLSMLSMTGLGLVRGRIRRRKSSGPAA